MDIILVGTDTGTIRTTTTGIPARWFTFARDITGIGIIGAAAIAATFGTTAFTGGKSEPVYSLSWPAIVAPAQFFCSGAA
jgi:hypothetical protein